MEILLKDYETFSVIDKEINLFQCENEYGNHISAEIENKFFYLGDKELNIKAAIIGWRLFFKSELSEEEMDQFLVAYNMV